MFNVSNERASNQKLRPAACLPVLCLDSTTSRDLDPKHAKDVEEQEHDDASVRNSREGAHQATDKNP